MFAGNEHEQCGEMSQTIAGQAVVAGARGAVKACCLWAADAKAAQRYSCCQREGRGGWCQLLQEAPAQTVLPCHMDEKNGPCGNYFGHVFNN